MVSNVDPGDDEDYYKLELQAGEVITLDIDYGASDHTADSNETGAPVDVDTYVTIFDAAGNPVAENDDASNSDSGSAMSYDSLPYLYSAE